FGGNYFYYPVWSPDGRYVVFGRSGTGLFSARADGVGQPQALTESKRNQWPSSISPDGKQLAYVEESTAGLQIWTVPIDYGGGRLSAGKPEPFLQTFKDRTGMFSPDGHWLAYVSD